LRSHGGVGLSTPWRNRDTNLYDYADRDGDGIANGHSDSNGDRYAIAHRHADNDPNYDAFGNNWAKRHANPDAHWHNHALDQQMLAVPDLDFLYDPARR
jgi:hypothetical protein